MDNLGEKLFPAAARPLDKNITLRGSDIGQQGNQFMHSRVDAHDAVESAVLFQTLAKLFDLRDVPEELHCPDPVPFVVFENGGGDLDRQFPPAAGDNGYPSVTHRSLSLKGIFHGALAMANLGAKDVEAMFRSEE